MGTELIINHNKSQIYLKESKEGLNGFSIWTIVVKKQLLQLFEWTNSGE